MLMDGVDHVPEAVGMAAGIPLDIEAVLSHPYGFDPRAPFHRMQIRRAECFPATLTSACRTLQVSSCASNCAFPGLSHYVCTRSRASDPCGHLSSDRAIAPRHSPEGV